MSIRNTTITQLRQMADQEGLVLQGCGGSLQEWQDGINQLLTEEGEHQHSRHDTYGRSYIRRSNPCGTNGWYRDYAGGA